MNSSPMTTEILQLKDKYSQETTPTIHSQTLNREVVNPEELLLKDEQSIDLSINKSQLNQPTNQLINHENDN